MSPFLTNVWGSSVRNLFFYFNVFKSGEVIKGWDIGVATMKKGEIAIFTLSPDYGYGKHGCPPKIKQNATLNFEVSMIIFSTFYLKRIYSEILFIWL